MKCLKKQYGIGLILVGIIQTSCSIEEPTRSNNFPPIILSVFVPSTIDSNGRIITARVVNFEGNDEIERVWLEVDGPLGFLKTINLLDDGIGIDSIAGDSIYSTWIDPAFFEPIRRANFTFTFNAQDKASQLSNRIEEIIFLEGPNDPPLISDVVLPDTIFIPPPDTAIFVLTTIMATDLNGDNDIVLVGLRILRPDSTFSNSGNPFEMLDDGGINSISGDRSKGDDVYSLTLSIPGTGAITGNFVFIYQAEDRAGILSNVIEKNVTFTDIN